MQLIVYGLNNMNIWIISDTHFGHEFLKTLGIRPQNYEALMWESMYKSIKEEDLLIHLGDLAFKSSTEVGQAFKLVKGNKVLIKGNHDGGYEKYYKMGFNFVCDNFYLEYGGKNIWFTHEPVQIDHRIFNNVNIHGHLHGDHHRLEGELEWYKNRVGNHHVDLAPEIWGSKVINLNEILRKIDRNQIPKLSVKNFLTISNNF